MNEIHEKLNQDIEEELELSVRSMNGLKLEVLKQLAI